MIGRVRAQVALMSNQAIVGIVVVIFGLVAIALHRVIPTMIHGALKFIFGEPVADDAIRGPSAKVHVLVVGVIILIFGGFMCVSACLRFKRRGQSQRSRGVMTWT